jgi:UDP-glucose 4-epimerase
MKLKRVLITGKNSYVGTNVEKWLMKEPSQYYVESISVRDDRWRDFDFSTFDVVLHVAGIAHIKESKKNESIYFRINRDLTLEIAKKAKNSNVKQFIFMSSMSVYGIDSGLINKKTTPKPITAYGKSKLEAEAVLSSLNANTFKVSILRPPMIYGKKSPGNYSKLSRIVNFIPIFPKITNRRSMLFIYNLAEFVKYLVKFEKNGLFFPQNKEYVNTSDLVYKISRLKKKKIIFIKTFNVIIKNSNFNFAKKLFHDLYYDQSMSKHEWKYVLYNFEKSIEISEM